MKILSFDIGIKNLAFCLLDDKKIYSWETINLISNDKNCNIKNCKNNIFYIYNNSYFCKKHIDKKLLLFKKDYLISNIKKRSNKEIISTLKEYHLELQKNKEQNALLLRDYYENNSYKLYKRPNCKNVNLIDIGINLKNILDEILKDKEYEVVLIENQIGPLANRMKTLQGMLTQYFIMNNKPVKYISSQSKLKLLDTKDKNYKQRKQMAIEYVPSVLNKIDYDNTYIDFFNSHKKKDDLSDCLLQAWSFIQ
jgi:hypothetical protein